MAVKLEVLASKDGYPYHLLSGVFPLHGLQLRIDEANKLLHLLVEKSLQLFPRVIIRLQRLEIAQ